jgi:hypothetical protein
MKPWSWAGIHVEPPLARAFCRNSSTSARLPADRQIRASLPFEVSAISPVMKSLKRECASSIAMMFSSMTMQAVSSLENCMFWVKPSDRKKRLDASRSFTGRFTKIIRMAVLLLPVPRTQGTAGARHQILEFLQFSDLGAA